MTTVLFVGDSITVGAVGVAQGKTNGAAFRGPAGKALGWRAVGPFSDPTGLLHGGVGGASTDTFLDGKAQFVVDDTGAGDEATHTWVLKYQPDVIHLMLGVNDLIYTKWPAKLIYDRLTGLAGNAVNQQRRTGKRGYVLISTVCESLLGEQVTRARQLNELIKKTNEVGKEYVIRGIDSAGAFNAALNKHEPFHALAVKKYTVDGTHPNQAGYDLIAASLVKAFRPGSSAGSKSSSSGAKVIAAGGLAIGGWALGRSFKWW